MRSYGCYGCYGESEGNAAIPKMFIVQNIVL